MPRKKLAIADVPGGPVVRGAVEAPLSCWRCGKMLAEAAGPGTEIRCMRCGARSRVPVAG